MTRQSTEIREVIRIENLNKTYKFKGKEVVALKDVTLTVNKGDIFGIVGVSGAGKSTLARCINLLEKPTSGKITVNGVDLSALSEKNLNLQRRKIAMIFQNFNLFNQRTVFRNVAFPLEIAGADRQTIGAKPISSRGTAAMSVSATRLTVTRRNCQADRNSELPLQERLQTIPTYCCATRQPVRLTALPHTVFCNCSKTSTANWALRLCLSLTR